MSDNTSKFINDGIKTYLPIVSGIIIIAAMWGTFSTKTTANSEKISSLEISQAKLVDTLTDLRVSTGQLQASVGNLQGDVSFIKSRVK